jgi:hypothetical protein
VLNVGERIRAAERQTRAAADEPGQSSGGGKHSLSLARQHKLITRLSYKFGYCWLSVPNMARDLAISERMVQLNNDELTTLALLYIERGAGPKGVNKLWPLPKGGRVDQVNHKARIARALACHGLALVYRVLWLVDDESRGTGDWVAIPLKQFRERLTVPHRQSIGNAIEINYRRGLLGWRKGGHGNPGQYRVLDVRRADRRAASEGIIIEPDGNIVEPAEAAEGGVSNLDFYRQLRKGKRR